jgi:hypothetical protein
VDDLGFQLLEKRLRVWIVFRSPTARHALSNSQSSQAITEARSSVLNPAIAVKDQAFWLSILKGRVERPSRELRAASPRKLPGQDATRTLIENYREV